METEMNLISNAREIAMKATTIAENFLIAGAYLYLREKGLIEFQDQALDAVAIEIRDKNPQKAIDEYNAYLGGLSLEDIQKMTRLVLYDDALSKYTSCIPTGDSLSGLVIKLLGINGGDLILDCGSGYGNFLINVCEYASKNQMVLMDAVGIELSPDAVELSNMCMRILCIGKQLPKARQGNALNDNLGPYTHAFVFPPLGLRPMGVDRVFGSMYEGIDFTGKNSMEWVFIDRVLKGNPHRAVAITTTKALYNDADKEYRGCLIRNGLLEGVIELPVGAIAGIGIRTCLLVFSHGNESVKLVDGVALLNDKERLTKPSALPIEEILRKYDEGKDIKTIQEAVECKNLVPSNALLKAAKLKNAVKLSEVAKIFTGSQYTARNFEEALSKERTGWRFLTSGDINDGCVNWKSLPCIRCKDDKFAKFAVQKGDVIVTSKSSKVKTVVVDIEPEDKILVTGGMIIVRPDLAKIDPTFLKMYLDSPLGQLTLKSIQKGTIIITINAKDLAGIDVPGVSLKRQAEIGTLYNEKLSTILAYKREIAKMESALSNLYLDELGGE